MHYFAYCTWLHDAELRRFFPEAKLLTKGYAANHRLQFHAAGERTEEVRFRRFEMGWTRPEQPLRIA